MGAGGRAVFLACVATEIGLRMKPADWRMPLRLAVLFGTGALYVLVRAALVPNPNRLEDQVVRGLAVGVGLCGTALSGYLFYAAWLARRHSSEGVEYWIARHARNGPAFLRRIRNIGLVSLTIAVLCASIAEVFAATAAATVAALLLAFALSCSAALAKEIARGAPRRDSATDIGRTTMHEPGSVEDLTVRRLRYVSLILLTSSIVLGRLHLFVVGLPLGLIGCVLLLRVERRRRTIAEHRKIEEAWKATFGPS